MKGNKISTISIVTTTGFKTYSVGFNGVAKIEPEIVSTSSDAKTTFYVGRNQLGEELFSLSASLPLEIIRDVYEKYYEEDL